MLYTLNIHVHNMYMHTVYYVHECMYLIISYIQRCYVQDTILVIPPYPYCIEEENDDVLLEDCWYARPQLLFTCYLTCYIYSNTCMYHVYTKLYMHKHVCTMFRHVHIVLPYPVQVGRIPDGVRVVVFQLEVSLVGVGLFLGVLPPFQRR